SVCRLYGLAVDINREAANYAPRLAEPLQQLSDGLEIVVAAAQSQIVDCASGHKGLGSVESANRSSASSCIRSRIVSFSSQHSTRSRSLVGRRTLHLPELRIRRRGTALLQ